MFMLRELSLPGVFVNEPTVHSDARGTFQEWFKASAFEQATGFPFDLQQANLSTSAAGVVRGLHFADVPPGQAKFVTCVSGAIRDVVMDVRLGSPTFGQHVVVELDAATRRGVFVPVGFAHGFAAVEDATVVYLTSSEYDPAVERGISPLSVQWPVGSPLLSDKDRLAPSLSDAQESGMLPTFEACMEYEAMLRDAWVLANEQAGEPEQ